MTLRLLSCNTRGKLHNIHKIKHVISRSFASDSINPSISKGPQFKKWFWISNAVMIGIPSLIGSVFIYNLKHDDEFYAHFNQRYPDLIDKINEYIPLQEKEIELSLRTDIGPIANIEELEQEMLTIVAKLQSQQIVRFQVKGSTSEQEIQKIALSYSNTPNKDKVLSFTIDEEDKTMTKQEIHENSSQNPKIPGVGSFPAGMVTWSGRTGEKKTVTTAELKQQLETIRIQQALAEESKYSGRDIDEADAEIAELEKQKIEIKKLLPRKRFLYIF